MNGVSQHNESDFLHAILKSNGDASAIQRFFESVWQVACGVLHGNSHGKSVSSSTTTNPYTCLIGQGWETLLNLLEQGRSSSEASNPDNPDDFNFPLLFKDKTLLSPEEHSLYGGSLFAAFLDGCSVVINHSDLQSPQIAALCLDLQKSFPHAYANTYLTPPGSQTVTAHADDRDVFVIQVVGAKAWKVYQRIPVPYPYPHEQAGKEGLDVPQAVLDGPVMIEQVLQPGDVLYMPRGYVHEAKAIDHQPSFHVTVALATHDWSLGGLLTAAGQHVWQKESIQYRPAIAREFGTRDWDHIDESIKVDLQQQIDQAIDALKREVTVESVHQMMTAKYRRHNERAWKLRKMILDGRPWPRSNAPRGGVGRLASENVVLSSQIRAATDAEKASLPLSAKPSGLHVREENYTAIMSLLATIKSNPATVFQVRDLRTLLPPESCPATLCDLTLLSFARRCVELGAFTLIP